MFQKELFSCQSPNQAGGIPATATHFLHFTVISVYDFGNRQFGTIPCCLFETNPKILAHPVDGKAKFELIVEHRAAPIFHLPGTRGALGDYIDDRMSIEPRALREVQTVG